MKIAIFAGPTGGHFYPALSYAEAFRKRCPESEILFVTGERGRALARKAEGRIDAKFEWIPDFPFPRPHPVNFIIHVVPFLLKLHKAFHECGRILDSYHPHVTIGFGSYIAFPGLVESRRRKIPTLIHEQNRLMGKANRWLTRFADRVALNFEDTQGFASSKPFVVTGLPLRSSLLLRSISTGPVGSPLFSTQRTRILILGGSQGARSLNRLWLSALGAFSREEKRNLAVIHLTGEREDIEEIKKMYFSNEIEAWVAPFYEQMEELFPQADLAITRGGAGTLAELALFGLPAIVVPYPGAESHQELNARYYEERGGLSVLPESSATPQKLQELVSQLVRSSEVRNRLAASLRRLAKPDASERLVDLTLELIQEEQICLPSQR